MKANPGGQIDLKDIVGRDQLIEQIWDTLEQQSIRMNAERRIGKTTIIKKLRAEPRAGWVPIFQDLEQYHSAREFALAVYREVDRFLSARKRSARRVREFFKSIGGAEVGDIVKLPDFMGEAAWKNILLYSIQDLVQERERQDERPLKALKQSRWKGSPEAVEQLVSRQLLDVNDPWELNHYRERIPVYYGKDSERVVLGILDGIAVRTEATSINELLAELKSTGTLDDRDRLLGLLRLIEQDHYLSRDAEGRYRFRFPLLQRWWKLSRGL